jgi:hypothetical protein
VIPHLLLLAWFFQADPTYTISGTVVNRVGGKPLNGTHVSLVGASVDPVITGPDGRFRFDGLKAGKYGLAAERTGFVRQSYQQRSLAVNLSTGIVTGEHESTENIVFGLIPGGVIAGTVTDTRGNPVQGMRVLAYRVMGLGAERRVAPSFNAAITDDRGEYRIPSLSMGSWVLAFTGWTSQTARLPSVTPEAFPTSYFPGTTVAARAASIRVEPGKEVRADAILAPVAAVQVKGEVKLPNVSAGSWVTLNAEGPFGSELSIVRTPVTGNQFSIPGVPEGRYIVNLTNDENRRVGRRVFDVGSSDTTVTVGDTPFAHIREKVEIRGTLKNPNSPAILVLVSQNLRAPRTLDAEGRAEVGALAPGQYEVIVTKGQPLTVLSMNVQGATQAGGLLNIPETGEVSLTIVADASVARDIPGRVLRGDKPEGGLLAILAPSKNLENTTLYRFDQSDSDGTFTWRAVPPGEYLMFAFEAGEPLDYASAEAMRELESKAQKITITDDPKQTAVVHVTAR